jgi:FkbM family methyltransferase
VEFDHPVRNAPKLFAIKAAELGIQTVLDVGANTGQFAVALRKAGYRGRMVSFEPLSAAYAVLVASAKRDPYWQVAPRAALGAETSETEINIAKNLVSSSFLQVQDRSVRAAEATSFDGKERITIRRIDDMMEPNWKTPLGLKIDTQGFELRVLQGAPTVLSQTMLVLTEMSLVSLYEDGAPFAELYQFLETKGFRCISLTHGFVDKARHELLQVDGIFVRSAAASTSFPQRTR